tara:strand:- start:269 stop:820 length:552 start_codon:yes stop_codon:yes gene_type:complete
MDALKWFKFDPRQYESGRISVEPEELQGYFIRAVCVYWGRAGECSKEFLSRKLNNDERLEELIIKGYIKEVDGEVFIKWIDEEIALARGRQEKAKAAISKRWATPKKPKIEVNTSEYTSPTLGECLEYFTDEALASKFFQYYEQTGWKMKNGATIVNWKRTADRWINEEKSKKPKYNILNGTD